MFITYCEDKEDKVRAYIYEPAIHSIIKFRQFLKIDNLDNLLVSLQLFIATIKSIFKEKGGKIWENVREIAGKFGVYFTEGLFAIMSFP
jgi:hypothetical protein